MRSSYGSQHPAATMRVRKATGAAGVSLIELIFALGVLALIVSIAGPSVGRMRAAAGVQNARHATVTAISMTRTTAMRYGRTAVLRIDAAQDRIWTEIDTSLARDGSLAVQGRFAFRDQLGVDLESDRTALCFDGRGIATTRAQCPLAGATISFAREGRVDTVVVSPTGRVLR